MVGGGLTVGRSGALRHPTQPVILVCPSEVPSSQTPGPSLTGGQTLELQPHPAFTLGSNATADTVHQTVLKEILHLGLDKR